jgi:ABC-2 type transport system ATP-binding protein
MPDDSDLARIMKVLSVDTRVRIVRLLKGRNVCVNALAAQLGVTQGAVSQHLRIMRDANMVSSQKRGYYVHYCLNRSTTCSNPARQRGGAAAMNVASDTPAIETRGLAKSFANVRAVDGIDLDVGQGELFGLLGPNGAGKTTLSNMLTGLARPDGGTIRIAGIDCSAGAKPAQHLMGIVPDESNLYPELTGLENLTFCGALYGLDRATRKSRARELLDQFGLADAAGRKFGGYSKGMRRKLTIAAAIIHRPPILFLDEPTTGIDVASARQVRQMIADLNAGGATVLLTTHYIEEAERLCRRIGFIVRGRIVRLAATGELMQLAGGRQAVEFATSGTAADLCRDICRDLPHLECHAGSSGSFRVESTEPVQVGPLVRLIESRGAEVFEARRLRPSLEEVFVEVTGIEAAAMKKEKEKAQPAGGAA